VNHHNRLGTALVLLSLLLATSPAAADWIVTSEGEEIETVGPWKQQGRLLVLTLAENGELVSMRTSEVDLEASAELTAERAAAAEAPESPAAPEATAEETRAVIVLTDADFTRRAPTTRVEVEVDGEPVEPDDDGAAGDAGGETEPDSALTVVDWEQADDPETGGVVLMGRLVNRSRNSAAGGIGLRVRLYDSQGEPLGDRPAQLSALSLQPGDQSSFQVAFPEVPMFSAVKFEATSQLFQTAEEPVDD
jgi:hypothetical protein